MTEKVSVKEIADELGIASKDVLEKAKNMGIEVKAAQSKVTMEQAENIANYIMNGESVETSVSDNKAPVKAESDTPKEENTPKEEAKKTEASEEKKVSSKKEIDEPVKEETKPEEIKKEEEPRHITMSPSTRLSDIILIY